MTAMRKLLKAATVTAGMLAVIVVVSVAVVVWHGM
jgi:hypothetical protein